MYPKEGDKDGQEKIEEILKVEGMFSVDNN